MATPAEKLFTEVVLLEERQSTLERKQIANQKRIDEIEASRQAALVRVAEGDERARRELRNLDSQRQESSEDFEALAAAEKKLSAELTEKRHILARVQIDETLDSLEAQMTGLAETDSRVQQSLQGLHDATKELFSCTADVAGKLRTFDENRWGSKFAWELAGDIRGALMRSFQDIGSVKDGTSLPSFIEVVRPRLIKAVCQLRHENLEGTVKAGRHEKLYRTLHTISGVRNLHLPPGSLIALTAVEAEELLAAGALTEVIGEKDSTVTEVAAA